MNANVQSDNDFSLSEGGPFHDAMVKMRLQNKQLKLAVLGLCLTWLPLIVICTIEGTLYSNTQLSFLKDVGMQARVLVALPMLIMIKFVIDSKVTAVAKYLAGALMTPEEGQEILNTAFRRAKKMTGSAFTEIILLLIVLGATISFARGGAYAALGSGTTSWMMHTENGRQMLSGAGYWAIFISIPLFQFFLLRWLWRYIVWMLLLFRLSKSKLNLLPTHADGAGGLGVIMLAQRSFNLIFVAGSVVLSGQLIEQLIQNPNSYNSIRSIVIAYIVTCIVFILSPLLFFMGKLFKTKNDGLLRLSHLGASMSRKFESEWINDLSINRRMEQQKGDPSMLYDYSGIYGQLQKLRPVPITLGDIIGLALTLFAPFIPILFIHFSVGELLQKIAGLLV